MKTQTTSALRKLPQVLTVMTLSTVLFSSTTAQGELKKGDRIVFLGDSITQAGANPGGYVTLAREAIQKKHPDLGIEVIGAGISGNRVPDLEKRLDHDVLQKKPTIVVIYIGINDVWHSQSGRGTPRDEYEAGLKRIVEKIQKTGARVILCTPSVIGEKHDLSNPLDGMLEEFCGVSRKVAAETKSQLLDLRQLFISHLTQNNPDNKESGLLTADTVHLNAAGNRFVAKAMLAALTGSTDAKKVLRHVVLFSFKEDLSEEQVHEVEEAFSQLPNKIKEIADFEFGVNNSPEVIAKGFTHCFLVTFKSAEDRDAYLPHPAHKEFIKLVGDRLAKVLVVDYWARE